MSTAPVRQKLHTSLDDFRQALIDYRNISAWAMGGAVAVPLVDYVARLGPPWPWAAGVPIITSIVELLTLILVFHFCSRSRRKAVSRRLVLMLVLLLVGFGTYLYVNSSFTFSSPVDGDKHVKGFALKPDVAPLITAEYSEDDALKGVEYRPEEVWTASSISLVRLSLLFLWLLSFACLSGIIASFVLFHRRHALGRQVGG
jgi:hypothetical protein